MTTTHRPPAKIALLALSFATGSIAQAEDATLTPPRGMTDAANPIPITAANEVTVAYDEAGATAALEKATFANRDSAAAEVESGINASSHVLNELRLQISGRGLTTDISNALTYAQERLTNVRTRLTELRHVTVDDFDDARDDLVTALEIYAEATADVDNAID